MTANQIAFAKLREEQRANREQERLKQFEADSARMKAQASQREAQTAFYNALTNRQKAMIEEQKRDSAMFKDWTQGAQNIIKSITSIGGALGALFG